MSNIQFGKAPLRDYVPAEARTFLYESRFDVANHFATEQFDITMAEMGKNGTPLWRLVSSRHVPPTSQPILYYTILRKREGFRPHGLAILRRPPASDDPEPDQRKRCPRLCGGRSSVNHMILYCPVVQRFWHGVWRVVSALLDLPELRRWHHLDPLTGCHGFLSSLTDAQQHSAVAVIALALETIQQSHNLAVTTPPGSFGRAHLPMLALVLVKLRRWVVSQLHRVSWQCRF